MSLDITTDLDAGFLHGARVRTVFIDGVRRISAFDIIKLATSPQTNSRVYWARITKSTPDLLCCVKFHKFSGERQRDTPTINSCCIKILINAIPGKKAAKFKKHYIDMVVYFLGGDKVFPTVLPCANDPNICSVCDVRRLVQRIDVTPAYRALFGTSHCICTTDQTLILKASVVFAKTWWSSHADPVMLTHPY